MGLLPGFLDSQQGLTLKQAPFLPMRDLRPHLAASGTTGNLRSEWLEHYLAHREAMSSGDCQAQPQRAGLSLFYQKSLEPGPLLDIWCLLELRGW